MDLIKYLFIGLFLFTFSCSAPRNTQEKMPSSRPDILKLEAPDTLEKGKQVHIELTNISKSDTFELYKPRNLEVSKKEGEKWRTVKTLYCPCGASCPAPPEHIPLFPGKSFSFHWDQKEQWCGEVDEQGIPRMHSRFPGYGTYRMAIRYLSGPDQKVQSFYVEFSIVPSKQSSP